HLRGRRIRLLRLDQVRGLLVEVDAGDVLALRPGFLEHSRLNVRVDLGATRLDADARNEPGGGVAVARRAADHRARGLERRARAPRLSPTPPALSPTENTSPSSGVPRITIRQPFASIVVSPEGSSATVVPSTTNSPLTNAMSIASRSAGSVGSSTEMPTISASPAVPSAGPARIGSAAAIERGSRTATDSIDAIEVGRSRKVSPIAAPETPDTSIESPSTTAEPPAGIDATAAPSASRRTTNDVPS